MQAPTTADILNAFEKVMERAVAKTKQPAHKITPALFWMHCKGEVTEWQLRSRGGYFSIRDGLYPEPCEKEEEKIFIPDKEEEACKIRNRSRYVITSAQAGVAINMHFFRSLLNYCQTKKADLLVIPLEGRNKEEKADDPDNFDPKIVPYLIKKDTKLNKNVKISMLGIKPTIADPLNGLARFTEHSTVFGSPKLAMRVVPVSNCRVPKVIMSTGAVTYPNYNFNKVGRIARQDHVYSAIVVEVVDSKMFHYRQLVADAEGDFYDIDKKYSPGKVEKIRAEALIWGDIHRESTDPKVIESTLKLQDLINPKALVFHDIMDTYSVNHHHEHNMILKARKAESGKNDLRKEYMGVYDFLVDMCESKCDEILVVSSNHDDAVDRFVKGGEFFEDPINYRLGLELSLGLLDGFTAMETFMRKVDTDNALEKCSFLKGDEDRYIAGIVVSNHGHQGISGMKGSVKSQEIGAKNSVIGHGHSPIIWHRIWQVGTSTYLRIGYNEGFSTWLNTHCIIFPGGTRQLINIVDGKWHL